MTTQSGTGRSFRTIANHGTASPSTDMRLWISSSVWKCSVNPFSVRRLHCNIQNCKDKKSTEIDLSQLRFKASRNGMPTTEAFTRPTQKKRGKSHLVSSSIYFQVIGNGEVDGARGLLLHTDQNDYLFNCGEGTQRIATEECGSGILENLGDVFFTSRTWKNMGGFPGICLTIHKGGSPGVRVHGPSKCMALFDSVKDVVRLGEFDVLYQPGHELYEDANIKVQKIPIFYHGPEVISKASKFGIWHKDRITKTGKPIDNSYLSLTEKERKKAIDVTAIAYFLTIKSKPGKLDFEKCMELKVPCFPLLEKLKAGQDVSFGENITVKSSDVLLPKFEEQKILIIECPNKHYLQSLLYNKSLNEIIFQDELVNIIFHFTPKWVMQTESYRKWMASFKQKNLKHILVNDQDPGLCCNYFMEHTKKLRMVAPLIFPKLWDVPRNGNTEQINFDCDTVAGKSGMQYHLYPNPGTSVSEEVTTFNEEVIEAEVNKMIKNPNFLQQAHKQMVLDTSKSEYPKFTFLGTGGSIPNEYRNVSCILTETKPDNFIILDCGEGSLLQLYRHFGKARGMDILKKLKGVYISHLHADHHLGLVNFIQQRSKILEGDKAKKLYIIAPSKLSSFLTYYDREFEPILEHAVPIWNEHLVLDFDKNANVKTPLLCHHILKQLLGEIGLKNIYTCKADHALGSFCVTFTTDHDFKVVYTGDTRPNQGLIDIGKHEKSPDLLIHEATMEHMALKEAIKKQHSTFIEAVKGGRDMGASFTILTHFSQRYSKIPPFDEFYHNSDVAVAFDHLSVNPQTFHLGHFMYPSLEKIFSKDLWVIDQKRATNGKVHTTDGSIKVTVDKYGIKKQKLE